MRLDGATVLITGANRGIGRAIARELVDRGAHVLAGVRELDAEHRAPGEELRLDVSSRERIVDDLHELGPRIRTIDVLVNNAGLFTGGLLERQDGHLIEDMIQVNLLAPIVLAKAVLPSMVDRGAGLIVNNASVIGHAPFPGASAYAASKGGLAAFSESLRRELEGTGVGVLELVTPGTDTEMMDTVKEQLAPHVDMSSWDPVDPREWAGKVADAIEGGDERLDPGGAERLATMLPSALLDAASRRAFSR